MCLTSLNIALISLQNGTTALWMASQNGHVDVVNILLSNGASADIQKEVIFSRYTVLTGQWQNAYIYNVIFI